MQIKRVPIPALRPFIALLRASGWSGRCPAWGRSGQRLTLAGTGMLDSRFGHPGDAMKIEEVFAYLCVSDAKSAIDFYRQAFRIDHRRDAGVHPSARRRCGRCDRASRKRRRHIGTCATGRVLWRTIRRRARPVWAPLADRSPDRRRQPGRDAAPLRRRVQMTASWSAGTPAGTQRTAPRRARSARASGPKYSRPNVSHASVSTAQSTRTGKGPWLTISATDMPVKSPPPTTGSNNSCL